MSVEPSKSLDRRMMRVWRIHEAVGLVIVAAIAAAVLVFYRPLWLVVVCAAVVALQLVSFAVLPQVQYRRWRYEVTTTDVIVRSGLVVVKTTVIPMVRVQHVETKQGPVLKANGLASVTIATAGDSFEIPGLGTGEAEALRDQVAVLARIAQEDV